MIATSTSDQTRERILLTAFEEFYEHGFQGGSLNRIIEKASTTKGALFHHFRGKQDLGYHVVDEVIRPAVQQEWIGPLLHCSDPVAEIKRILFKAMKEDADKLCHGCPLNNLAQEMSPLDEEFRNRVNSIYDEWRHALAQAFRNGIKQGTVRSGVVPEKIAAFIVASLSGMIGTAKNAQSLDLLKTSAEEFLSYLETQRP